MDDFLRAALLLDFYGDMLTDRQKQAYGMYYNENFSLREISENLSITRQGVRDLIKRADVIMVDYENKLKLIERDERLTRMADEIINMLKSISIDENPETQNKINDVINKIRQLGEV